MKVCLFVALLCVGVLASNPDIIQTTYGPIEGYTKDNVRIWNGVPFAAPPIGDLRFKPPQAPTPWTNTLDCTKQAEVCPQLDSDLLLIGNEDCLYMDIYVPENHTSSDPPLPVMLWLFGGGYVFGDGYEAGFYNGINLAYKHQVIVVTLNYRLSVLGFMALDELKEESNTTGNYGIQDQRAAMQWVQNNIASFGGNPDKVMLFGESAGAFSTCIHVASPASAGLFHVALMESGTCDSTQFFRQYNHGVRFSMDYATLAGCDRAQSSSGADYVSCLRGLSADEILKTHVYMMRGEVVPPSSSTTPSSSPYSSDYIPVLYPVMPWGPVIDGSPEGLMELPLQTIQSGNYNKVPLVAGTNKNEGTIFIPMMHTVIPDVKVPLDEYGSNLTMLHFFHNNQTTVDQVALNYPEWEYSSYDERAADVLRDFFFVCATRRALRVMQANGQPVWMYHFTYVGDWIDNGWPFYDYHSSELEFVWDNAWPPIAHHFSANDTAMAASFGTYWTNLAKFADPNGSGASAAPVYWPQYNSTTNINVMLQDPVMLEANLGDQSKCDFWDTIAPVHY